jgi:CelD/BcsL family acetyltransferase involved in cellulose biosynthesis
MAVILQRVTDASTPEWEECWRASDQATYFHSPEWAALWCEYTRGRVQPRPKLASFSDGARVVLPLCFERRLGGLLSRYVSSPEGTFGGWLSRDPLTLDHAHQLMDWLLRGHRHSLVWRLNPYDPLCFQAGQHQGLRCRSDETYALELAGGPDVLFKRFKSRCRSDIRRAQQAGFVIELARTEQDYHDYHQVYENSLRRWGNERHEGYRERLFSLLFERRSPHVQLWLARHHGQIVSGNVCFYARRHVVYWLGATLEQHLASGVAKLLMYEIIRDSCHKGYSWFDFNPSATLPGVKFFKEGFGAKPLPAPLVYVDTRLKQLARSCAARLRVDGAQPVLEPLPAHTGVLLEPARNGLRLSA